MRNILLIILSIACTQIYCQDVEQKYIGFREKWYTNPITIGGSLGFNSTYYNSSFSPDNNIPFMYNAFVDVQMDILGIAAPLSFFYSNQNIRFRLPAYRFVGISPFYRGHTLLLGDRSMNLSQYSLAGIGFTGVGAESKISYFIVKAIYGR